MKFFERYQKLILIVVASTILRLFLSFFGTLELDHGTFVSWSGVLYKEGFRNFYNSWSDYLPGYPYVLWLLGRINSFEIIPTTLLFKLPAILADIITGIVIYKILVNKIPAKSKGMVNETLPLVGAAIYVFNPAIISNSALWGQVDSLTALASILAIYLFPNRYLLSAVALAVGTVIKPQAAFIFPVILFLFIKEKRKITELIAYVLTGLAVFILSFVPYWNHGTLPEFIIERLTLSLNQYPYTSVNAFNFWGLMGGWKADNIYYQVGGYLFTFLASLYLAIKLKKNENAAYYLTAFVFAASFVFFTRMHERHLLPVFAPLAIAAVQNPILLIPYIGFSLTYLANLGYAYYWITDNFKSIFNDWTIKILEVINIGLVVSIFYVLLFNIQTKWKKLNLELGNLALPLKLKQSKKHEYVFPSSNISPNLNRKILFIILGFAFITRVFSLNSPSIMYFDEVYHAFTAKVIMSDEGAKAWEWWNTPPEGYAYEWTHPPLAKLGMALGMSIFGQNSFGWRIPGALFGLGAVYLIYLLSKTIFKDEKVGLLSAAFYSLDGLALVTSRIGMNDSYILFFILLSLYLYMKDKNFLSALAFGFALSSKWSSVWAVPIFAVIFLAQKKKISLSYIWFFTLPIVIYIASYFDMFLTGHSLKTWWEMQQQMWWYHTGLRATHPYGSAWWQWPLLIRPIYLYTSDEIGGTVSRIYAFGNPLVFWFGLVSVITCFIVAIRERSKALGLVVFSYLIFFVPWALSPRIMFLYHYLPSIPFMALASGYILRRYPKMLPYFFTLALIVFIYFYPHYTGLRIPLWLDSSYYWFSSWR